MRHRCAHRKLNRTSAHRKAMFKTWQYRCCSMKRLLQLYQKQKNYAIGC